MMRYVKRSLLKSIAGQCVLELRANVQTGASKKKGKAGQLTKATAIGQGEPQ